MFVVKIVTIPFSLSNASSSSPFATVVCTEHNHVVATALFWGNFLDPLFRALRLKETLKELVDLPGIGLEVGSFHGSACDGSFIETEILYRTVRFFCFPNYVG